MCRTRKRRLTTSGTATANLTIPETMDHLFGLGGGVGLMRLLYIMVWGGYGNDHHHDDDDDDDDEIEGNNRQTMTATTTARPTDIIFEIVIT